MSLIVNFDTCLFFFRMHRFIGFRLVFLLMDLSFILLNSISILLFLQNVISLSSKIFVFNWHNLFFCLIFQFNHRTRFGCSVLLSIMDTRIHFGWIRLFWFCFENDRINFFFPQKVLESLLSIPFCQFISSVEYWILYGYLMRKFNFSLKIRNLEKLFILPISLCSSTFINF